MFWECHIVTSSIDKLLDQPADKLQLQDLLDESDLIQECLTQNTRLIDYLIQPNVMHELVHHVITYPNDDNFHNAHVVSELLSGDFQRIQETLLQSDNLDRLYAFLLSNNDDARPSLNPILASYFSRILITLIIRRPNELLNYFKTCTTFKEDFIRHLDSTSIADILYRFIADCSEQRSDAIEWYEEINLIDSLVQEFLRTSSTSVQMNIVNLLSEFLRLAFDQHTGIDSEIQMGITGVPSNIERLFHNENNSESSSSSRLSSRCETNEQLTNATGKWTPLVLAQHILSKSNLEKLFDGLAERPILVANGCDFLITILDLLGRHMPAPICIPFSTSPSSEDTTSSKDESDKMQINDEEDTLPITKSDEKTADNQTTTLASNAKDPLIGIYLTLLEVIPSRLPSLITLLSQPCAPLSSSPPSGESPQTVKYQFISEPLGSMRLNLIKFFSKLLYIISNDSTGDCLYQIVDSNRLIPILIDLFLHHIYNNFLHSQFLSIIRLIFQISSTAVKQPDNIWTRLPLVDKQEQISTSSETSNSSPFHYTRRCSYQLFQSLMNSSEVNLIERLLDQYELTIASTTSITGSSSSDDAFTSALLHTRFTSPNAGHVAQLLRCLRDHASIFNNYSSYFKTRNDQEHMDETTTVLEMRWQTAIDHLNADEKKWSAMHNNDRTTGNSSFSTGLFATNHANNSNEAIQRRETFHARSFGSSGAPYLDDDDDDEVERFNIDDELMNNDQMTSERKVDEMKKISFEPQFPAVFDEQSLWHEHDETDTKNSTKEDDDEDSNMKARSAPPLPNLFENHRTQQKDKTSSSTESSFEQLCSLRANDHGSGPIAFPFQSSSSSIQDEATLKNDPFWHDHPVYLINANDTTPVHVTCRSSSSSSSSSSDDDDAEDMNIPDDEKFFVLPTSPVSNETIASNNMMDVFRRQSSLTRDTNNNNCEGDQSKIAHQSVASLDTDAENSTSSTNDKDDEDDVDLQNNFSFLIAKGMLRPS